MNPKLEKRLNLLAILLYMGALSIGLFTHFSIWEILVYGVLFDLGRIIFIWQVKKETSHQETPKDRHILLAILILGLIVQLFSIDAEAFVLLLFIFNQLLTRVFPKTQLFASVSLKNGEKRPSPGKFALITAFLLLIILLFDFGIAIFDSPFEIWNLWLVPLYGFLGMEWLEKNFQQSLIRVKSFMLIIFFLSTYSYLSTYKMLWPTSFSKSYFGLSERPVNTLIEGGWDWGSRHLRFKANYEEVEQIVATYTCGRSVNGRYESYPCLEKDSVLVYKNRHWYEPYSAGRPRHHWYVPDSIQSLLPVNIYYDSIDQIVEIFEMTEM